MSDFDSSTAASSVIERWGSSLAGKTVIITGASAGTLGGATTTALATSTPGQGPDTSPTHLILLARSSSKVQDVITSIQKTSPSTRCTFVPIELDDFDSVRAAARTIHEKVDKVDILINNAGVMAIPWATNKNGIERQFAVNHLGHFLLTGLLLPLLCRAQTGRVVNLSSKGYEMGPFRDVDWNFENGKTYDPLSAYAQSKTANILFTAELAKRYAKHGVLAFAVHPGFIPATSIMTHFDPSVTFEEMNEVAIKNTGLPFVPPEPKSMEQGISTTLVAALSPNLGEYNGAYLADCQVEEVREYARDAELAKRLWELSEELVGEKIEV